MGTKINERVEISAPKMRTVNFKIEGTAPLVMNKFSHKAKEQMMKIMEAGSQSKKGSKREANDFNECYESATYRNGSRKGWIGLPATAIRSAMVRACSLVGFTMTHAKLGLFIEADGVDFEDGTPLIKLNGEPRKLEAKVRNDNGGADIRIRPMFEKWDAAVRIRYDEDMFSSADVANLLLRVGLQVGLLEGRPSSTKSCGMGWGLFKIASK